MVEFIHPDTLGRAIIEDGYIVIRVKIEYLPVIMSCLPALEDFKITDVNKFAEGLCVELNDEDDDGTTPIHLLFDKAIEEAINMGAEGVEEISNG